MLKGTVNVYVTFTVTKFNKSKTKTKQMCEMNNKVFFGELSLLFDG